MIPPSPTALTDEEEIQPTEYVSKITYMGIVSFLRSLLREEPLSPYELSSQ